MATIIRYWMPVFFWMGIIFAASHDSYSLDRSQDIILLIMKLFYLEVSITTVDSLVLVMRKFAHTLEFGILALLIMRALRYQVGIPVHPWRWSLAGASFACCAVYAVTDELHQSYVPHRMASLQDVWIDMVGVVLALITLWIWERTRKQTRCS